ncbi:hypothetical protein BGX30_004341, partial [Mortierella sp. GBA39]
MQDEMDEEDDATPGRSQTLVEQTSTDIETWELEFLDLGTTPGIVAEDEELRTSNGGIPHLGTTTSQITAGTGVRLSGADDNWRANDVLG